MKIIREISVAIDCLPPPPKKIKIKDFLECDYTAKENFSFACVLIKKCIGKINIQELKTFGILSFGEV